MSVELITALFFGSLLFFLFLGVPLVFTLGGISVAFLFFSIGSDHPVFGKRGFHTLPGQIFLCIPVTVFVTDFGM